MRIARFGKRNAEPVLYLWAGRMLASDDRGRKGKTKHSQGQKSATKSQAESSKKIAGHNFRKAFHRQNAGCASVLGYVTGRSMECHVKNHRRPILELCGSQLLGMQRSHRLSASVTSLRSGEENDRHQERINTIPGVEASSFCNGATALDGGDNHRNVGSRAACIRIGSNPIASI